MKKKKRKKSRFPSSITINIDSLGAALKQLLLEEMGAVIEGGDGKQTETEPSRPILVRPSASKHPHAQRVLSFALDRNSDEYTPQLFVRKRARCIRHYL